MFLTSSSASEDSQESDELKGSFFTHALLSGLLGAADENRDGQGDARRGLPLRVRDHAPRLEPDLRRHAAPHLPVRPARRGRFWYWPRSMRARRPGPGSSCRPGKSWLLFQENADGAVVGEVASADRVRRLSLRAGRYFVRGRGPEVLLEGTVVVAPGSTVTVDESKLQRTAYARLVRKGEGSRDSVLSLEAEARMRTSLVERCRASARAWRWGWPSRSGPSPSCPRVAWCRTGYTNEGLHATTDQCDFELQGSHVWDLAPVSIEVGLIVGARAASTSRSAPPAPRRPGPPPRSQLTPVGGGEPRPRRPHLPLPDRGRRDVPLQERVDRHRRRPASARRSRSGWRSGSASASRILSACGGARIATHGQRIEARHLDARAASLDDGARPRCGTPRAAPARARPPGARS